MGHLALTDVSEAHQNTVSGSGSERTRAVSNGSLAESSARTEKRRVRTSASSVVVRSTRKAQMVVCSFFVL